MGHPAPCLRSRVAAGEDMVNTTEARGCKTVEKISKLWAFVEGLNQSVGCKRTRVAKLLDEGYILSGRSLLWHCRRVKARSAGQYETCVTGFLSKRLLML